MKKVINIFAHLQRIFSKKNTINTRIQTQESAYLLDLFARAFAENTAKIFINFFNYYMAALIFDGDAQSANEEDRRLGPIACQ